MLTHLLLLLFNAAIDVPFHASSFPSADNPAEDSANARLFSKYIKDLCWKKVTVL